MAARKSAKSKKPARKAVAKRPAAKAARTQPLSERRRQPETLRLRSLGAGLTVNDLAKSLAWYRDVLGFVPGEEWRSGGELMGMELRAGAVTLWLNQDDWKKGRERIKGLGFRMFAETAQDIDALAAKVKASGGVLSHEPQTTPWGDREFGIVDPDGYAITISNTGA